MKPIIHAQGYAMQAHAAVNHLYDGHPYYCHLDRAHVVFDKFQELVPEEEWLNISDAIWLHDTIEDCRVTYTQIREAFNETVAELVYAVTDEKGRNRKERHGGKYYHGIITTPYATFVKLCDRIANIEYSKQVGDKAKLEMYRKERGEFVYNLYLPQYVPMFVYMDELTKQ